MAHQTTPETATSPAEDRSSSKRQLLKLLGAGAAGSTNAIKWSAPLVATVFLPSHAQASLNPSSDPCGATGSEVPGSKGSGGPTASDPTACCDSVRPANPAYPTDATYLDEGCCAKTGKTDATICCDDNVADKTDIRYAEQCCDAPGRDAAGALVKNAQGEYICCDGLDQNSDDYKNYCCQNKAIDAAGKPVKDANGNDVCCEGTNIDPEHCCIKKEVTHAASIPRNRTNWAATPGKKPRNLPTNTTALSTGITIPKWDPADGPLGEASITISTEIDSEASFENTDSQDTVVTFTAKVKLTATGPSGLALTSEPSRNISKEVKAGSGQDGAGTDFWRIDTIAAQETETVLVTDQAALKNDFTGTGSLPIDIIAQGQSSFAAAGNYAAQIDTFASATVSVTYKCKASTV